MRPEAPHAFRVDVLADSDADAARVEGAWCGRRLLQDRGYR